MGRHPRTPAAPALTAVAAALALAAGCSSGGDGSASRDAPAAPASASDAGTGKAADGGRTPEGTAGRRAQSGTAQGGTERDGTARKGAERNGTAQNGTAQNGSGEQRSAARTPWCDTDRLAVSLRALSPGAGQRYAVVTLANTSDEACRTEGYIGLQLLTDARTRLSTDVVRDRSRAPRALTLAPGASAWSRLHWGVVPGEGDSDSGPCQPSAARLQVTPPDSYAQEETAWTQGPVCQGGRIEVTALSQGTPPS